MRGWSCRDGRICAANEGSSCAQLLPASHESPKCCITILALHTACSPSNHQRPSLALHFEQKLSTLRTKFEMQAKQNAEAYNRLVVRGPVECVPPAHGKPRNRE